MMVLATRAGSKDCEYTDRQQFTQKADPLPAKSIKDRLEREKKIKYLFHLNETK